MTILNDRSMWKNVFWCGTIIHILASWLSVLQESGYSFPLEAVKTLKKLMESDMSTDPLHTYSESASLCTNPKLPREFTAVCEKDDAGTIFQNLG